MSDGFWEPDEDQCERCGFFKSGKTCPYCGENKCPICGCLCGPGSDWDEDDVDDTEVPIE